jgi:hypothetical protein
MVGFDSQNDGALLRGQGIGFVFVEDGTHAGVEVDLDLGEFGGHGDSAVDAKQEASVGQ